MKTISVLRSFAFALAMIALVVFTMPALARPGGGSSFSGGSSSRSSSGSSSRSSSGSSYHSSSPSSGSNWSSTPSFSSPSSNYGGGGGSVTEFFFWLILVFAIIVFVVFVSVRSARAREAEWSSSVEQSNADRLEQSNADRDQAPANRARARSVAQVIKSFGGKDDRFSQVVFEDFLYALFSEIHAARASDKLQAFAPYLWSTVRKSLEGRRAEGNLDEVRDIVVGAMKIDRIRMDRDERTVTPRVVFTANYTEVSGGQEQSFYVEEVWTLRRSVDTRSRPADKSRVIGCPNCGAALEKLVANKCKYCGETTVNTAFDWKIISIDERAREARGPMLTGTTEEVGTDLPTIVDPEAKQDFRALVAADPALSWSGFLARVELVFQTFHVAWSSQDLSRVRPFLSDALFDTQRYWVATYKAQGLVNVTGDPRIVSVHLARVVNDSLFDAMTVRVHAECIDYTIDAAGKVVGGSKSHVRQYSEYWTFIRSAGKTGAPRSSPGCPNCGAPADKINLAGVCASCSAKITMGEFDWVLSRIEQDEVFEL